MPNSSCGLGSADTATGSLEVAGCRGSCDKAGAASANQTPMENRCRKAGTVYHEGTKNHEDHDTSAASNSISYSLAGPHPHSQMPRAPRSAWPQALLRSLVRLYVSGIDFDTHCLSDQIDGEHKAGFGDVFPHQATDDAAKRAVHDFHHRPFANHWARVV